MIIYYAQTTNEHASKVTEVDMGRASAMNGQQWPPSRDMAPEGSETQQLGGPKETRRRAMEREHNRMMGLNS